MWAACDLAMYIINSKIGICDNDTFSAQIELPAMYYKPPPNENFQNTAVYIPSDMYAIAAPLLPSNKKLPPAGVGAANKANDTATMRTIEKRAADQLDLSEMEPTNNQRVSMKSLKVAKVISTIHCAE